MTPEMKRPADAPTPTGQGKADETTSAHDTASKPAPASVQVILEIDGQRLVCSSGRERALHFMGDEVLAIDDSGGNVLWMLPPEEVVALVLEWCSERREAASAQKAEQFDGTAQIIPFPFPVGTKH